MTRGEALLFAARFMQVRAPELADAVIARQERGEITAEEAFEIAMEYGKIEGFDFALAVD